MSTPKTLEDTLKSLNATASFAGQSQFSTLKDEVHALSADEEKKDKERLKDFAIGEQVAHKFAYQDIPDQDLILIRDKDDVERVYRAITIDTGTNRVLAQIYVPFGDNQTSQIFVNITGTCTGATVHADTEAAPGEKSFQRNKEKIMSQINEAIGEVAHKTGKNVSVNFSGHSLGGALAQQFMNESMRYQATNLYHDNKLDKESAKILIENEAKYSKYLKKYNITQQGLGVPEAARNHFRQISDMNLYTWNSAGVSKQVEEYSNNIANLLVAKNKKLSARFGMIGGDGVQCTSEGTVLSNAKADVCVAKMDQNLEGFKGTLLQGLLGGAAAGAATGLVLGPIGSAFGATVGFIMAGLTPTVKAHTSYNFNEQTRHAKVNYELINNSTPHGQALVTKRLQNKSAFLNSSFGQGGRYLLHKFGNMTGLISRAFCPTKAETVMEAAKAQRPAVA